MTVTLPETLQYGYVKGRYILAIGDQPADADSLPNAIPAVGTITFSPALLISKETTVDPPTTVIRTTINCILDSTGRLTDPAGALGVYLITGVYKVSYNLTGVTIPPHDILVTSEHTEQNPLDLTLAAPSSTVIVTPSQYAELSARIDAIDAGGSAATTEVAGISELATPEETIAGTDLIRVVTPAGVKAALDAKTVSDMSTYAPLPTGTPDGTKYLRDDNSWQPVAGDVTGPAGATAGNFAVLDATGKVLSDSGLAPSDFAPALGADDNYVTNAEKTVIGNTSGTNTGDQDLSGLVPKSLVDAKGDLIVATAADTVARLAVGATNGHVLTVDSAETSGLKWAAASGGSGAVFYAPLAVSLLGLADGGYGQSVGLADPSGVFSNGTPANQPLQLAGLPVSIGTPMTVVSAYVTLTSAVAGGTARVGLYGVNSSGQPTGAPLLDSGVILTDTTGTKSFSPASPLVLPAGTYWTLAVVSSTSVQFDGWRYARGGWRSGGFTLSPSEWNMPLEVASTANPLPTLTATRLVRHNWSGRVSPLLTLQGPNS